MNDFKNFLDRKRLQHERALARFASLGTSPKFLMKLRVRVLSKLASPETKLKGSFKGRRIVVQGRMKGQPLNEAEWVTFTARRFVTMEAAVEYGLELQTALSVAAALGGIAIDVGPDNNATFTTSEDIKKAVAQKDGFLIDDVHGVDVYADTPKSVIMFGEATITTTMAPSRLLDPINALGSKVGNLDERGREAALLMNAAHMAQHPIAMLTLCVAAVEMLSAGEKWNAKQKTWIKALPLRLADESTLSASDKAELERAVSGLFNFGALAKTRRLIENLGKDSLLPQWEDLYSGRSNLFHGNKYMPYAEIQRLGGEAGLVCKEIVDAYLEKAVGKIA